MVPDELIDEVARLFALLGDTRRLRLVRALYEQGELAVGDVSERTGIRVANASQHLLRLAAVGLVARRRVGKSVLYRISDPRLHELCAIVCASVQERGAPAASGSAIPPMPAAGSAATLAASMERR